MRGTATYRLQLTPGFGFTDAARAVPALRRLGISHLYVSPILMSRPGSQHGYDVVDPSRLDPELGGAAGFAALERALARHGMKLIVDIVPNHMAAHALDPWWWRFLRDGPAGEGGRVFDQDPSADRILVPVLGAPLAEVLAAGEITVAREPGRGIVLRYHEHRFPLSRRGARQVARAGVRAVNRDRALLADTLDAQHYRLAWWREANTSITYRRFFDINELAGVRVEDPWVFERTHALLARLAARGAIDGFRVDHIDGLRDPRGYLRRLKRLTRARSTHVEKILGPGEQVPADWRADGTTGYEVATAINGLQAEPDGLAALDAAYRSWTGEQRAFAEIVLEAKRWVLGNLLAAEVDRVVRAMDPPERLDREAVRDALVEVTARLDVYRTYGVGSWLSRDDRARIVAAARASAGAGDAAAVRFVRGVLLRQDAARLEAADRWQQLSGPAMAKGFEDTALYRFNRLISLNDVGGEPDPGHLDVAAFVRAMNARPPGSLNATSTHDSKRSEDVRARVSVLSEIPEDFAAAVRRWSRALRSNLGRPRPTPDEEWLLFQTLLGVWPLDAADEDGLTTRVADALVKSAREGKRTSSWTEPDEAHEAGLRRAVGAVFEDRTVREQVAAFAERIAWPGAVNALAQIVLKAFVPGVPDVYQGTERWAPMLVDPDNRRPADLDGTARLLEQLDDATPGELLDAWRDGRIKLFVLRRSLEVRARRAAVFGRGDLRALRATGPNARHVVALERRVDGDRVIAVVPRFPLTAELGSDGETVVSVPRGVWRNAFTERELRGVRVPVSELLAGFPVALLEPA